MSHSSARTGRRRRVLNEEALTASALGIAARTSVQDAMPPGDTPRYGAGANIENHPQVTDFVPRRYRLIALVLFGALALAACGELATVYAAQLSQWAEVISAEEVAATLGSGLLSWTSVVVLLVASCYARLIYSLRRHRVDDSRGRYRIWRLASWLGVALSLNALIGAHALVARIAGHFTGWSVLPGNVIWWLAPAALCGGWLLLKLIFESSECRATLASYLLAAVFFVVAGTAALWAPEWAASYQATFERLSPLAGHIFMMLGTLLFARYVVLDVQGLIDHAPTTCKADSPDLTIARNDDQEAESSSATSSTSTEPESSQEEDLWVDGSEPEDDYESQGKRRMSKAERKRLRKQKSRNRAA